MLTRDLVRVRTRQGKIYPQWVDVDGEGPLDDAQSLITLFEEGVGWRVGEIEEAIDEQAARRTDVIFIRGLAKLLWDRSEVEQYAPVNGEGVPVGPSEIREAVFMLAAARGPVRPGGGEGYVAREEIVAEAAATLGIAVEELERGIYADLKAEQKLLSTEKIEAQALLERYNLSLAQACLLRAERLKVVLKGPSAKQLRAVVAALKFRRLLYVAERKGKDWYFTLDGPLSLLKSTTRYGLNLALFLPVLVRCARWSLEAELRWGEGRGRRSLVLELDDKRPLVAPGRLKAQWVSEEEKHLIKGFKRLKSAWEIDETGHLVDLDGRDTVVADLVFRHPDGRVAYLDLIFAWRRPWLMRRLELLREVGPAHWIVALSQRGNLHREEPDWDGLNLLTFKGVVSPRKVLEALEAVAIVE